MASKNNKQLSAKEIDDLIEILKNRFNKNTNRHKGLEWTNVETKLRSNSDKLWSLLQMEKTGGEPDVIFNAKQDKASQEFTFYDCCAESPKDRRSLCYDRAALDARKEFKPVNSVIDRANEMGIEVLNEQQYRYLQQFGKFDCKTQSWIKTPDSIRALGGAIFADYRYGEVFIYHNGAQSYYAARGFRAMLMV